MPLAHPTVRLSAQLVWVVDDSPLELQEICKALEPIATVEGFTEAGAMLERISSAAPPALVLLDWQLPGVSGLEACRFLRERHDEASLPILILTGRVSKDDVAEGLNAGANDYVVKPYDRTELVARARTLLRIHQQTIASRAREEWFETTLKSVADAVITTDSTGRVTFINQTAEQLSLWRAGEVLGRAFSECFPLVDQRDGSPLESSIVRTLRDGRRSVVNGPIALKRRDGSLVPVEESVAPIGSASIEGVVAIFRDVTERVALEQAAKERADFAEKLVGIVSHDLRNPLNVIALSTSILREEPLEPAVAKTVGRIQAGTERATRLVNDLLDFTQARLGTGLTVTRRQIDVHRAARQAYDELSAAHPTRKLRLESVGDATGEFDPDRLVQLITNLVDNAIHYGDPEREVSLRTRGETGAVVIEVHNHGAPIPPDFIGVMFEPLKRAVASQGDRSVGLGLYIVKHIVDAHGGTIAVTSNGTDGTLFTIRLPRPV